MSPAPLLAPLLAPQEELEVPWQRLMSVRPAESRHRDGALASPEPSLAAATRARGSSARRATARAARGDQDTPAALYAGPVDGAAVESGAAEGRGPREGADFGVAARARKCTSRRRSSAHSESSSGTLTHPLRESDRCRDGRERARQSATFLYSNGVT